LEDLQKQVADGTLKELGVVLKADVHGSIEAVRDALLKLSTEKVKVKVIHAGVGGVTESDVMLAAAGKGIIIGFNVVPETGVALLAEQEGVEIRRYSIIYELLDEVRKSMEGLLAPIQQEKIVGHAEVRQVFTISKVGVIAGCGVKDGSVPRGASIRLVRDSVVVYTGKIESLKRFKDDAKEVTEGNECGISIGYNDIKEGDVFEAFIIEQIAQKL
jgi:translation initiation factor IF-2